MRGAAPRRRARTRRPPGDFVPLRLVCETPNGHDYHVLIPDYINPALAGLLLLALGGAAASGLLNRARRRAFTGRKA